MPHYQKPSQSQPWREGHVGAYLNNEEYHIFSNKPPFKKCFLIFMYKLIGRASFKHCAMQDEAIF